MNIIELCIAMVVTLILGIILYAVLVSPSCEERGGVPEFSHLQPIYNGTSYTMVPMYKCVITEELIK